MQRAALAGRTARTMSFDLAGCLAGAYYIVVMSPLPQLGQSHVVGSHRAGGR